MRSHRAGEKQEHAVNLQLKFLAVDKHSREPLLSIDYRGAFLPDNNPSYLHALRRNAHHAYHGHTSHYPYKPSLLLSEFESVGDKEQAGNVLVPDAFN